MIKMRFIGLSVAALTLLAGGLAVPAQAAPTVFEDTLAFSAPVDVAAEVLPELVCPEPGDLDGTFYKFIDLEGDYTHFKLEGPPRLFTDPSGQTQIGDYDLDIYVYDADCNQVGEGITSGATEKFDIKKPARYAVVHYYVGIHPDLPFTLQVDNERIK